MRYAFLVPTFAAAALLLASCSDAEEELPQDAAQAMPSATASPAPVPTGAWTAPAGTPVSAPGWTTVRLLNVTVSAPEGILVSPLAGYTVSPTEHYARPVILIEPHDDDHHVRVAIDAETGTIVDEVGSEQDRAALQLALDTVRMSPLDPKTAPWPYSDTAAPSERAAWANTTYPVVDPLSGIWMGRGTTFGDPGDPGDAGQCNDWVRVWNGRSSIYINACTGEAYWEHMQIDPDDAVAFDRLLKTIEVKS